LAQAIWLKLSTLEPLVRGCLLSAESQMQWGGESQ